MSGNKTMRIFELQKHTMDVLFLRGLYYLQTFCSQVCSQNAKHLGSKTSFFGNEGHGTGI